MTNEEYLEFVDSMLELVKGMIAQKNRDYTSGSGDALFNLRDATNLGLTPMHGLALRMSDKFKRLQTFVKTGSLSVKNEGAEDVFKDLIGYSLMGLALLREQYDLDFYGQITEEDADGYNKLVSEWNKKSGTEESGSGSKQAGHIKGRKLRGSGKR
jgi:hypothetical protein